jgi:choline/ethanolamine kinase
MPAPAQMALDPAAERCLREAVAAVPELGGDISACVASRISGGISNHLFMVSSRRPDEAPIQVLVRLYGADEPLCDRASEESLVQLLSSRGFGPRVLGVFEGGRVEQFWAQRRPLAPAESLSREPHDFAAMVASRLAELHGLQLSVPGRPTAEAQLRRWLGGVGAGSSVGGVNLAELSRAIAEVAELRPSASTAAEEAVAGVLCQRTLCHLDLFAANLMYSPGV